MFEIINQTPPSPPSVIKPKSNLNPIRTNHKPIDPFISSIYETKCLIYGVHLCARPVFIITIIHCWKIFLVFQSTSYFQRPRWPDARHCFNCILYVPLTKMNLDIRVWNWNGNLDIRVLIWPDKTISQLHNLSKSEREIWVLLP